MQKVLANNSDEFQQFLNKLEMRYVFWFSSKHEKNVLVQNKSNMSQECTESLDVLLLRHHKL